MSFRPAPDLVLDGYRLIRVLGRGGFGEVWLCRSQALDGYHALKFVSDLQADRLEKELHSLEIYRREVAGIGTTHLVPIEHVNRNAAGLYYVMPLADGATDTLPSEPEWQPLTLAEKIRRQHDDPAWFSPAEIVAIVGAMVSALRALGSAGLVHRDVKPDNILFFSGQPRLGDISLLGEDAAALTRRGTPGYATPTWYKGGHPDMYGLAATLYTLLTGNEPDRMGRSAFLWPPRGRDSLTPAERMEWTRLHAVVRRATHEKVPERFVDFEAMGAALVGEAGSAGSNRRRFVAGLALVVVAVAALLVAFSRQQANDPPREEPVVGKPAKVEGAGSDPTAGKPPPLTEVHDKSPTDHDEAWVLETFDSIMADLLIPGEAPSEQAMAARQAGSRMIREAFADGNDAKALSLLNQIIDAIPPLGNTPAMSLFRALLLKRVNRHQESDLELLKLCHKSTSRRRIDARVSLLNALDRRPEAELLLTRIIEEGPSGTDGPGTVELLQLRARIRVLMGKFAEAAEDQAEVNARLASGDGLGSADANGSASAAGWHLLESLYPAYRRFLEDHGEK